MNIEQVQRMVIGWVAINYSPRTPNSIEETFNAMSNIPKANVGSPEGWEYRVQLYGRGDSYFHHVDKNESTKLDPRFGQLPPGWSQHLSRRYIKADQDFTKLEVDYDPRKLDQPYAAATIAALK